MFSGKATLKLTSDRRSRVGSGFRVSRGEAGRKIEIKYIHKTPSGDNSYTLRGGGTESYAARFTWFVFREVEIINWPGELRTGQIKAEAVYSNVETTGKF